MLKTSKFIKLLIKNSKNILKIFIIIYFIALIFLAQAAAKEIALYSIPEPQFGTAKEVFQNNKALKQDEPNDVYFYHDEQSSFYLKFYKYPNGIHIFSVTDNTDVQNMFYDKLKQSGIILKEETNKDYKDEYKYDFIQYVRNNKTLGFKVMPDKVSKISETLNEQSKKIIKTESPYASNYSSDTKEISLTLLDTKTFSNQDIKIIKNKYRLKNKSNRKFQAYEYILYNNTPNDMMLLNIDTTNQLTKQHILISVHTDFDKLSMISSAGSMLAPFTFGISYVLKLPEVVSGIKTTKELSRYMKDFPKNYVINSGDFCRILTLHERNKVTSLKFNMLVNFKEINIKI